MGIGSSRAYISDYFSNPHYKKEYKTRLLKEHQFLVEVTLENPWKNLYRFDLQIVIRKNQNYLKAGGCYGTYQFRNTCVLDSLLVGLHISHFQFNSIRQLFQVDQTLSKIIDFMYCEMWNEAKALCLIKLNMNSNDCKFKMFGEVDVRSLIEDYLPMFRELICSRDKPPHKHRALKREFERFGTPTMMGLKYEDPSFVLVNVGGKKYVPPEIMNFRLGFMQLWKKKEKRDHHMIVGLNISEKVVIYDNNPREPPQMYNINSPEFKHDFSVYSAAYMTVM